MTDWLIKFGLGGVQEFIAQSRKTRDLRAGSELIAKTAAAALNKGKEMKAIPCLPVASTYSPTSCPHQLVLRVNSSSQPAVRSVGEAMAEEAKLFWSGALGRHPVTTIPKASDLPDRQLAEGPESYWVAVPIGEGGYPEAFRAVSRLFDFRRWTRTFAQAPRPPAPASFKPWTCLQCGTRTAVFSPVPARSRRVAVQAGGLFTDADSLCAVCLGKRMYPTTLKGAFPSTHSLARDRFFRLPHFEQVRSMLKHEGANREEQLEVIGAWEDLEQLDHALSAKGEPAGEPQQNDDRTHRLLGLYRVVSSDGITARHLRRLTAYYAAVLLDGDEMGKWFWGEKLEHPDQLDAAHPQLGQAIGDFTQGLEKLVRDHRGALVYAGGDDGFALLPLDYSLPFLLAADRSWSATVAPLSPLAKDGRAPSFSAHLAVVHHKAPLQQVVGRLHADLDATKRRAGRNAFSIMADVRSGAATTMIAPWAEIRGLVRAVEALSTWRAGDSELGSPGADSPGYQAELRTRGHLPARLPHQLLAALPAFFAGTRCTSFPAAKLEAARVAGRGSRGIATSQERLHDWLEWLYDRLEPPTRWHPPKPGDTGPAVATPIGDWERVQSALSVVAFLARELAWPEVMP